MKATLAMIAIPMAKATKRNKTMCKYFLMINLFVISTVLWGQSMVKRVGEIKYISQNSFYINLGKKQGLTIGDTLHVVRNGREIARIVVESVANLSAACKSLRQMSKIKQGDRVEAFVRVAVVQPKQSLSEETKVRLPNQGRKSKGSSSRTRRRRINKVSGRFSLQSIWFDDKSSSNLDYNQLAFRSKLKVQNIVNSSFDLRIRWRSRRNDRTHSVRNLFTDDNWMHSVYEFGLVHSNDRSSYEFSLGRILSHRIRGIGYIDGGLFSYKINPELRLGMAGGTQPNLRNSGFQTNEQKFGVFINYEKGDYQSQRFETSLAFSGSYVKGVVSREFLYLQNNYWMGSKFSIYQTLEVDINRGWKKAGGSQNFQLSNFFVSTHYEPSSSVSLNASFDARKIVRVYQTRSIPDSLFDETIRQGFHAGLTLRLPHRMRFSGNFGVRLRRGAVKNTFSASGALTMRQIFHTWATLNLRLAYFSTMFTKGYRPNFSVRLPVKRGFAVNLSGGSYIYQTAGRTTSNAYAEATGYYRLNRWLFANFGYRAFVEQRLKSGRLFVETGVVF